jgi:CheY-like chemotaxis protein
MQTGKTFFIVDDDPDDVDLFIEAVNEVDNSIICVSASDGYEALNKLRSGLMATPDMIFLDLNMPRINGKQCLVEIKKMESLSDIPVVIFSTSSFQNDIDETLRLGASCFLTKPSSFRDLCKVLLVITNGNMLKSFAR